MGSWGVVKMAPVGPVIGLSTAQQLSDFKETSNA
jgi:hypothetical protein